MIRIAIAILAGIVIGILCSIKPKESPTRYILKRYDEKGVITHVWMVNSDLIGKNNTPDGTYEIKLENSHD